MNKKNILMLIILFLLAIGIIYLALAPVEDKDKPEIRSSLLLSSNNDYILGNEVLVRVDIDSKFDIDGVDVIIDYDPEYFEFDEVNAMDVSQSVFSVFVGPVISEENHKIKFSAVLDEGGKFYGNGNVAILKLKTKKMGSTDLKIVYEGESTRDSNVSSFDTGEDYLDDVQNITININ